jgi:WD40 repeat protein
VTPEASFCPYVGLKPYTPEESAYFFGREREQAIVSSNLLAAPITVLYGASGVGKSSLLRAGVVPGFGRMNRTAVVYFNRWKETSFGDKFKAELIAALGRSSSEPIDLAPELTLPALLDQAAGRFGLTVVALFDQFEEYLLYVSQSDAGKAFDADLARAVNQRGIDAGFLIAIREDWLSKLQDHYKSRMPILRNTLELRHMDAAAAERAIRGPLQVFNERFGSTEAPLTIEDELVAQILEATETGRLLVSDSTGAGLPLVNAGRPIETSFLQLVLAKLWDVETAAGSHVLRLATLEHLGGAQTIVRDHVGAEMRRLSDDERGLCARMFRFLVMPMGGKIAQRTEDLAALSERSPQAIAPVLEKLAAARILSRSYPPERYEIFHDVLGPAVLEWRARYQEALDLAAAERRTQIEARNARRFRLLAIALAFMLVLVVGAGIAAYERAKESRSRELAAGALSQLSVDPERAVLLAMYGLREKVTLEAEDALHQAVMASRVRRMFRTGDCALLQMASTADGSRIAAACADGVVRVWDQAGRSVLKASGHSGEVRAVVFSSDGKRFASAGADGTARIWDASSGALLSTIAVSRGAINAIALNGDGNRVAVGCADATASLWNTQSGRKLRDFNGHKEQITGIAMDADDARLVTASLDGSVRLWDAEQGAEIRQLRGVNSAAWSAAFSPDGNSVAAAVEDRTIGLWDVGTGALLKVLNGHANFPVSVTFSPDGLRLASAGWDETARIWDVRTGNQLMALAGHTAVVRSVAFGPDGRTVLTGSADGSVRTWDTGPAAERFAIDVSPSPIHSVAYSPNGERLATAGGDGVVRVWDAGSGIQQAILSGHDAEVEQAVFNRAGDRLASAASDFTAAIWSVPGNQRLLTLRDKSKWVRSVAFSPDGALLLTGNYDQHARLWDAVRGDMLADVVAHNDRIQMVAFSPDGRSFATGSSDGTAKIWDTRTRSMSSALRHGGAVRALAFHPDGRTLATAGDGRRVLIWDLASGRQLLEFSDHPSDVSAVAFDTKGERIASAGVDGAIKLWKPTSGEQLLTLAGHGGAITGLSFSPDDRFLAVSGEDGAVRIYITGVHDLKALARARVTRPLTNEECRRYLHASQCPPSP